jgi:hypothetical protein
VNALLLCVLLAIPEAAPEAAPEPVDLEELQDQLARTRARVETLEKRETFLSRMSARFSGYLDVGFFVVQGNGSGVRRDYTRTKPGEPARSRPEFSDVLGSWVLLGDPLGTAINSRGEPADLGDSRAIRFDPIHSGGHPSFIVNALNLGLFVTLRQDLTLTASMDFLPRDREIQDFRGLGDFFDLKLAYLRYELELRWVALTVDAGKFDSLHGVEYRKQESPERVGITPSLICRYTCGRPVGLKVRVGFFDRTVEAALALTNGSHQSDLFPFSNETDFNSGKTVSGRLQYKIPVWNRGIELAASGSIGTQDRQSNDGVLQWHYGFSAQVALGDFTGTAEFVTGRALGKTDTAANIPCGAAPCLFYRGAYGQVAWRMNNYLTPYVRVDWRAATHRRGNDWAYVSEAIRGTFGLRGELTSFLMLKAEYVVNREHSILEFPDDVFTTSLVVSY